jgi:hypothetical protein
MLISISVLEDQNRSYKRKLSEYGIWISEQIRR